MADAQRQVVEVCSYYHKNKDLLDRLAAQAGTVPATSGIMIALQKKKRSCPLAKRSTVQRWWKNRWWALSADERKRVGKGRPTFLTSRQEEQMLADNPSLAIDDIGNFDEFQLDLHASLMKGKCVGPPGFMYTRVPNGSRRA